MPVIRHTLESLLRNAEKMDGPAFVAAHPGLFLVAMGRLTVAQGPGEFDEDHTTPLTLGSFHDLERKHPLAGHVFQLLRQRKRLLLGRGTTCDVQVPDESVSEAHCLLEVRDRELLVIDLGSTNGTVINGKKASPQVGQPAADGDMLSVARYSFQVVSGSTLGAMLLAVRGV